MHKSGVARTPLKKNSRFSRDWFLACVVLSVSVGAFVLVAPLDPDPHHDGYQFTVALAVSEGLRPHSDVFSQYGPVTSLLHSLTLLTWGPTVLSLRLLTAVMLGGIAASGFVLARLTGIGAGASLLISVLWVALAPAWGVFSDALPLWPWPSVLFTLVAQGVLLTLIMAVRSPHSRWLWPVAGVLLAVSTSIRVNQGLPLVFAVLLAVLSGPNSRAALRANMGKFLAGFFGTVAVFFAYLIFLSDPLGYINDAITGATSVYLIEGFDEAARVFSPVNPAQVLVFSFILASVPLFVAAYAMRRVLMSRSSSTLQIVSAAAVASAALLLASTLGYYGRIREEVGAPVEGLLGLAGLNSLGAAPLYAAWIGVLAILVHGFWWLASHRRWTMSFNPTLALFAAGAFTVQVIPRWDVYHLWWAGPLLMIASFSALSRGLHGRQPLILAGVLAIPYIVPATYAAWNHLTMSREMIQSGALIGMKTSQERARMAESLSEAMADIPPRSTRFLCDDALMAAVNGQYLADSPNYVEWGWSRNDALDATPDHLVVCSNVSGATDDTIQWMGTTYSSSSEPLNTSLSPWSQTTLRIYSRGERRG